MKLFREGIGIIFCGERRHSNLWARDLAGESMGRFVFHGILVCREVFLLWERVGNFD